MAGEAENERNPRLAAGFRGADEGTRTLDLLHGKCERPFTGVRARSLKWPVAGNSAGASDAKEPERTPNLAILATESGARTHAPSSDLGRVLLSSRSLQRGGPRRCARGRGLQRRRRRTKGVGGGVIVPGARPALPSRHASRGRADRRVRRGRRRRRSAQIARTDRGCGKPEAA
jgi:hypothetical protein